MERLRERFTESTRPNTNMLDTLTCANAFFITVEQFLYPRENEPRPQVSRGFRMSGGEKDVAVLTSTAAVALPSLLTSSSAWDTYWLVWIFGFVAAPFIPPELYAAITGNGHTLSETMWRWEHIYWSSPLDLGHWTILHYAVAAFMLWLFLHIALGLVR